jgi:hypothetical protein
VNAEADTHAPAITGRENDEGQRLSGPVAALLGWVVVGLANVVSIARIPLRRTPLEERLLHHLFDFGQMLALGIAFYGAVWLVTRFGPKRLHFRALLLAGLSVAASVGLLGEDLGGLAERLVGPDASWGLVLSCAVVGLTVPAAWVGAMLLPQKPWLRLLPLLLGVAFVVANDRVLVNGYPDLHFWIAILGATSIGAGATGLPLGRSFVRFASRVTPRRARVALGALAALALLSIAVPPRSSIQLAMLERDTAFLATPLADLHAPELAGDVQIPRELKPWFVPRAGRADVPPSEKRLLPPGGIVIVITIDALRYDALAPRHRKRLPNLTAMMKEGVTFTQARSFGSGTRVSLAALLTGRYQGMLRWTNPHSPRRTLERDKLPRVPELLAPHGVHTVSAAGLPRVFATHLGIVSGFHESKVIDDGDAMKGTPEIVEHLLGHLKKQGPGSLFYYAHLLDPHFPYYRHREGPKGSREGYRQEVEYVDGFIGRIREAIRDHGLAQRTLLIVSSDHGEAFGEHGLHAHNKPLYEVMVHVPLIVEGPGLEPRTVSSRVSMMDIGSTVLDVFGVPTPGYFMGESLVPLLTGEKAKKHRPIFMSGPNSEALLFQDGIKVILRDRPRREEVYDIDEDPREEKNLRETPEGKERAALARAYSAVHRWPNGIPQVPLR